MQTIDTAASTPTGSPQSKMTTPRISAARPDHVVSSAVSDHDQILTASYTYTSTTVKKSDGSNNPHTIVITPKTQTLQFQTNKKIGRTGLLIVGIGGNNGTTVYAGILANKKNLTWNTKEGVQHANYLGSVAMCSTTRIGIDEDTGDDVYVPVRSLLPMVHPNDLVVHGWDISSMNLGEAMARAAVIDYDLQRQLKDEMSKVKPWPGVYDKTFIALNQETRANNVINGSKTEQVAAVREQIRKFKEAEKLDGIIVLWSANTERFADHSEVHETEAGLVAALKSNHPEISPSCIFAMASLLEGCSYINGSPQNTICRGLVEMARSRGLFIVGDDLKTGQTKLKSVLIDFLVSAGLKPTSVCSYNHLGNNDGLNLSAPQQFRSKEISKSGVVDDMLCSNPEIYKDGEKPDHVIVIKYVPSVGDSKRALDEYASKIFLNGTNTIVVHNTCEDSLLAAPIILDLVLFCELCQRVSVTVEGKKEQFDPLLSLLSYWCKAPCVPAHSPVVNALFSQREAIINFMKACIGLPPTNFLNFEHRLTSLT